MTDPRLRPPAPDANGSWPEAPAPEGIVIRAARPSDAASHVELWSSVVAEGRWLEMEKFRATPAEYRRVFRNSVSADHARFAAVAGAEVVGSVSVERLTGLVRNHVAALTMAVAAAWRGKKVGAALLGEGLRWAQSTDIEKVHLSVYASNAAAIALYRKFGFAEEGRLRRHSRKSYGYEDQVLMSRWLSP